MKKRLIPTALFVAYGILLIKVMVFKDVPAIKIGSLTLDFSGTDGGHPANLVPFRTIVPYLLGDKGLIIGGLNIVGNIALLVPMGLLIPLFFPNLTWKKSLVLAVASGLAIETLQMLLRVGIFDIDDVILNALGVMVGYWAFIVVAKWLRERKYRHIGVAAAICIVVAAGASYAVYSDIHQATSTGEGEILQGGDLCGGTGGIGQIVSMGNNAMTLKRKDGSSLAVSLTSQTVINTPAGTASSSALKAGDRVTLVGDPDPDGSFSATAVFVCAVTTDRF